MKNESVKSLEKSNNVLEEKRRNGQAKSLHKKTNTFTIIAMNFVQEQLKKLSTLIKFCSLQKYKEKQLEVSSNARHLMYKSVKKTD